MPHEADHGYTLYSEKLVVKTPDKIIDVEMADVETTIVEDSMEISDDECVAKPICADASTQPEVCFSSHV